MASQPISSAPNASPDGHACCPTCGQPLPKKRRSIERHPKRSTAELCDAVVSLLARNKKALKGREIALELGYPPRPKLPGDLRFALMGLHWGGVLDVEPPWRYRWTGRTHTWARTFPGHVVSPQVRAWRWSGG